MHVGMPHKDNAKLPPNIERVGSNLVDQENPNLGDGSKEPDVIWLIISSKHLDLSGVKLYLDLRTTSKEIRRHMFTRDTNTCSTFVNNLRI